MTTSVILGGAGFLGSHLCKRLLASGNKVICVDNLYTGFTSNIAERLTNKNFEFITHNIIEPLKLNGKIDEIYNLASPASPPHYQKDPIFTLKTNVIGMLNALELAREHHAKILQASTSEIYGDPLVHPQTEAYLGNVNPIGIRACYDEGKRCAETLCSDYHRQHNINTRIVRIFNTYGPRMNKDDGRVISNFIVQALNDQPITIYGKGEQTRSFCYVDDLIEGFVRLMACDAAENLPVNLGNTNEITVLECAEKILALTGSKSQLVFKELPKDDPVRRQPEISRAKKLLDWQPKVAFEEGLEKTIEYFQQLGD